MGKLQPVGRTVTTLESLRTLVDRLLGRQAEAAAVRDADLEAIRRKYDLLKARWRQHEEAAAAEKVADYESEKSRLETRTRDRAAWIQRAHGRAIAAVEEAAAQTRSQQKYENQKDLLEANRVLDADAEAAEKTWRQFIDRLDAEEQRFEGIKASAWWLLGGYSSFRRRIQTAPAQPLAPDSDYDEDAAMEALQKQLDELESLSRLTPRFWLARCFAMLSIWIALSIVGILAALVVFVPAIGDSIGVANQALLNGIGLLAVGVMGGYGMGWMCARGAASRIIQGMWSTVSLLGVARACADQNRQHDVDASKARLADTEERLEGAWQEASRRAAQQLERGLEKLTSQRERLDVQNFRLGQDSLSQLKATHDGTTSLASKETTLSGVVEEQTKLESEVNSRYQSEYQNIIEEWEAQGPAALSELQESALAASEVFVPWSNPAWATWEAPQVGEPAGRFADFEVDLDRFTGASSKNGFSGWERGEKLRVPLALQMPEGESVLFETDGPIKADLVDAFNAIVLRLLATAPVGRMRFTLFDPVGLGQSFGGLMHLTDYDDQLINRRIWTQAGQIDQCLRDLTEHMEKVTQMYLRNEYASLAEYNQAAGNIAEKYHVLVLSDFPVGFSETALKRLQSIAVSGPRCGVYLVIHHDRRQVALDESVLEDLREHCVWFEQRVEGFQLGRFRWRGVKMYWDTLPESEQQIELVHRIGQANADSNRVEVPFQSVVPEGDERWSQDTASLVRVPIGRTGAAKNQYLSLGKGTQQHVLIAGKTGSGKSTLFHVIVTNLALWCRPDQVEFYLVDFKKGVEFKCYATHHLPHARVIAIESDREFGLSVLERVDQELRRRGDLFRQAGVQDLAGYQATGPSEPLPRTLLMIDEFQEYFVEDDRVAQNAAVLLDRIVRQGRAFGIHVILGSQTLGGAYTLARTTFAQMVVRIALQCDEADAYLIMDEENAAPRLLSRPGEGLYNDSGGAVAGNSPFQTVWLSDQERDSYLTQIQQLAEERNWEGSAPVVFEGNAPAHIEENTRLAQDLDGEPSQERSVARAWLGAPNSIKGPTCATFGPQDGNHLLVLGQNDEMGLSLMLCSLISLAAQHRADGARFYIIDALPDETPQRVLLDRVLQAVPQVTVTLREKDLDSLMGDLDGKMSDEGSEVGVVHYLFVYGLQSFKALRPEDEFSFSSSDESSVSKPGEVFERVLSEGASWNLRVFATVDSYNSAQRFLSRKSLSEFEMRVLFQMSANDSAALIDSTKASQLGLYRALFYHERKGYLETFRPYAMPDPVWLAKMEDALKTRAVGVTATP